MDADLYVPGDGWLHRTDPRVKFLISIVMLALCFVWRNWAFILGILILEHVMLATDRVPAERIGWVWKILAVLIVRLTRYVRFTPFRFRLSPRDSMAQPTLWLIL